MSKTKKNKDKDNTLTCEQITEKLSNLPKCQSHPYLTKKKIKHDGFLQDKNKLVIPLKNIEGDFCSWLQIEEDKPKLFGKDTKSGNAFYVFGNLENKEVCIAEGIATAYAVWDSTGITTVAACSGGNMKPVAVAIKQIYPEKKIIITADNDCENKINVGKNFGEDAAKAVGGFFIMPTLDGKKCDYWDIWHNQGAEAIKHNIESAKQLEMFPENYSYKNNWLYYKDIKICSALKVVAHSSDENDGNHSLLLNWIAPKTGKPHQWLMLMEYLADDRSVILKRLLSEGLEINSNKDARQKLVAFLTESNPSRHIVSTGSTGWFGNYFVMPKKNYPASENVVLNANIASYAKFDSTNCELEEWVDALGKYIVGNDKLMLATCVAFATPLMKFTSSESCGFHFVGNSSLGKTTVLKVVSSICGSNINQWRSTQNAFEHTAYVHNGLTLLLDELSQADSKAVGNIPYMLGNGQGKARLKSSIEAHKPLEWSLYFLSTGEVTLQDKLKEVGLDSKAGMETRMINIPADSRKGFGIFDKLYDFKDGAHFSIYLSEVSTKYRGIALDTYLTKLTSGNLKEVEVKVKKLMEEFMPEKITHDFDGQVKRVGNKFALLYAAGVLASEYGILPCDQINVKNSISNCFEQWLQERGTSTSLEEKKLIDKVQYYFEKHGMNRFTTTDKHNSGEVSLVYGNIAGFRQKVFDGYEYFVFAHVYKNEIINGFNHKFASKILSDTGLLLVDKFNGTPYISKNIPGHGSMKVYRFSSKVYENCGKNESISINNLNEVIGNNVITASNFNNINPDII